MDCDKTRSLFTERHDGELPEADSDAVDAHLEECATCRAEWEDYLSTVEEISGLLQVAPSNDFVEQVEQRIRRRSRGRFFGEQETFSVRFAIVSFVLIVLFMLAYLVMTAGFEIRFDESGGSITEHPARGAAGESPPPARRTDAGSSPGR